MAIKILHVNTEKGWRGGERQTLLLAGELQRQGLENRIACRSGDALEANARAANLETTALPTNLLRAASALLGAARGCDLIHCHTGRAHGFAVALAWLHRKPIVATRRVMFEPKRSWFTRHKYLSVAKVVCISRSIEAQLERWGVPAALLACVPLPGTLPDRRALRAQLQLPDDAAIVGCIGALTEEKDHTTLLHAAQVLHTRHRHARVIIIGDGPLLQDLQRLRDQLGLHDVVHFAGFIPEAQTLIGAFDAFVLCSRAEGLGSTLLDAFAAGVVVAATAVGGIPELVQNGVTGLLAPPGEPVRLAAALAQLLDDAALHRRLTTAARQLVEREFTLARMAERYRRLYGQALAPA
jgi:L-malate glycosyltransferase